MSLKKYVSILHQATNIILFFIIKGCFQLLMASRILNLWVHAYSCTHASVVFACIHMDKASHIISGKEYFLFIAEKSNQGDQQQTNNSQTERRG